MHLRKVVDLKVRVQTICGFPVFTYSEASIADKLKLRYFSEKRYQAEKAKGTRREQLGEYTASTCFSD